MILLNGRRKTYSRLRSRGENCGDDLGHEREVPVQRDDDSAMFHRRGRCPQVMGRHGRARDSQIVIDDRIPVTIATLPSSFAMSPTPYGYNL